MEIRSSLISVAVASILSAASAGAAEPVPPDTSDWTCSKCPFDRAYRSTVEAGGAYVDEDSAKFGDYTGLDEKGGYVVASATGSDTTESGYGYEYELNDLGLDSREARVAAGKQGSYEFELFYDAIPHTIWDTTSTVYDGVETSVLTLPSGWVDAGWTGGMTALGGALRPIDIGYDRDRYGAAAGVWFGDSLEFTIDYRRDERDGTRTKLGSFGSVSTELPRPIDDSTDRLDARLRWYGDQWYLQAGYSGSIYDTKAAFLRWDNPFTAMVPGGDVGQMALEPDNEYHEFNVSAGWYGLPGRTAVTATVASGKGTQDTGFLPYTINPLIATDPLPITDLDGEISVMRADLTVSSRPLDRLSLRGAITYDERDNDSRQAEFTSIVHTDLFTYGNRINPVYGFERLRLYGSADYDVLDDVTIGAGGEYRETDRTGTRQEVDSEELADGWARVQWRPNGYLGFVVKGGALERDPDGYDMSIGEANGQNPLMRKYYMAYLYRTYYELLANVAVGDLPLTLSGNIHYGDDSYNLSQIGRVAGLDRRFGVDLAWTINEKVSAYIHAGQEKIDIRTEGSSTFERADWESFTEDDFETYGAGFRASISERFRIDFDYTRAKGQSNTRIDGVNGGAFPTIRSELDSFRTDLLYAVSDRLDLALTWRYESFDSNDWAIEGIEPATLPTVLSLGADPYNYDVNYVALSARYYFGQRSITLPE
ncbi:MAG TPA: MtrB/PioB family decaheme-associated outer membrane protein [Steroidobacteraceae bacterium]|nr:MtrB/PioB family decaheme-associated outer membrane protein [Steroidobacteraceae bacterium]